LLEAAGAWADAPPDMWQLVARALEPRAWARACGAARSLYAVRVRIARARLTRVEEFTRRAAEEWPAAGSIFLDLRAWADLPSLDLAWDPAACALRRLVYVLPALECLHVVEYGERALDCEARDAMGADPGDREFASRRARRQAEAAERLTLHPQYADMLGTMRGVGRSSVPGHACACLEIRLCMLERGWRGPAGMA